MTRTLGSGLAADIAVATAEATELIELQFADAANNPTPLYLTTAAQNLVWNAQTWIAVGGRLEVDALGESTDLAATTVRLTLAGVDQTLLALILGSRWRGRTAKVYYAHLSQTLGTVIDAPVVMFVGLMNGGFSIVESRGDFGGGTVDVSCRITEKVNDLVRVRGVRTNVASHQSVIPGATTDTFFQNVALLPLRKVYWGVKTPTVPFMPGPGDRPGGDPRIPSGTPPPTSPFGFPTTPSPTAPVDKFGRPITPGPLG